MSVAEIKKIVTLMILIMCLSIMVATIVACNSAESDHSTGFSTILGSSNFDLKSDATSTCAKGTILVFRSEDSTLCVRIVARIIIDSDDWGGIAFFLPNGCILQDVLSTYPENKTTEEDSIVLWSAVGDDLKYTTTIEIGRSREYIPTGGGEGTIVIECNIRDDKKVAELVFGIEASAVKDNGVVIMGLIHDELLIVLPD